MTHDELLARIGGYDEFGADYELVNIARAVVKLHKPIRTPDGCGDQCSECKTDYPCNTIETIQKELH